MGKDRLLKGIIGLQAVCMIVLAVVVVATVLPLGGPGENAGSPDRDGGGTSSGPAGSGADGGGKVVAATVGGKPITKAELQERLARQYGDEVLRTMMVRAAIDLESAALNLSVTDEDIDADLADQMEGYESEAAFYEAMKSQLGLDRDDVRTDAKYRLLLEQIATRNIVVTDEEVDDYLSEHADEYAPRTWLHLRWILTASSKDAEAVLDKLANGEDFGVLALTYSTDEATSGNGGDLGEVDSEDAFLDPSIITAAGKLETGDYAGPITTAGGAAVIQLIERRTAEETDHSRLRNQIRRMLALNLAEPLTDVENKLLLKYEARKSGPQ
ncbi:peptidylprolyl isomerase [Paenibacillus beijingensis]|uniref:peptidylprolyl isomerase n=1 Tax=Paenibacillus beijingensis TaxID=1126833 RepID=A0A0D5NI56_9BACL|nr:peptidylprolyl isomerase [Paenibacillus beijingensis]AJY74961.1 hypothetical protein VN24_10615 [Paenibacillus beijingensis]